jgi:hypothetical protein
MDDPYRADEHLPAELARSYTVREATIKPAKCA